MKITNPYVRNLLFAVDDIPTNPLVHIFMYITLAFGISFALFADPTGASSTILYKLTLAHFDGWATSLWGICAILAAVFNVFAFIYRRKWLGRFASYFGWSVWGFALVIYILGGFWFGALVASLPNLIFWTWQFVQVGKYHNKYHGGMHPKLRKTPLK